MRAHSINLTVPEDHRLFVDLPGDFPPGPAQVIVLTQTSPTSGRESDSTGSRKIVRLGGVLGRPEIQLDGDPIGDALQVLREERSSLLDQRARGYQPGSDR